MTGDGTSSRLAVLAAAGYIAIMAAGMLTCGHLFAIPYGQPDMVYVLIVFEVILSLYALVVARRLFGHWQCGFGPIDWRGALWLVPNFAVMAVLITLVPATGTVELSRLALVIVATMMLVGFSEELMFRGIVLRGVLRDYSRGKAVLVSAVLFALLHSVNILAFLPLQSMLSQLLLTFVFGLAMACFALRANSLVPLIVFHALWDMVQFLGQIYRADFGPVILIGILVNAIFGAALWMFVLRKPARGAGTRA